MTPLTNRYKIGKSNNPELRKKNGRTLLPDLILVHLIHFSTQNHANNAEKYLQSVFKEKGKHLKGEWFIFENEYVILFEIFKHSMEKY